MITGITKGLVSGIALNGMAKVIYSLYGIASSINDFIDVHIDNGQCARHQNMRITDVAGEHAHVVLCI